MSSKIIGSVLGNIVSIIGVSLTADQINTAESIISIICMVVGLTITIVSAIIIPLIRWFKKASKDGKIDDDEIEEGLKIIEDGTKAIEEQLPKENENDKN